MFTIKQKPKTNKTLETGLPSYLTLLYIATKHG